MDDLELFRLDQTKKIENRLFFMGKRLEAASKGDQDNTYIMTQIFWVVEWIERDVAEYERYTA